MLYLCAYCGKECDKPTGHVNRARAQGLGLYCGRECSGLGRRKPPKTLEQKKAEKSAYDKARREAKGDIIRQQKRDHHKATYDPVKAAEYRKTRMAYHVEFCRRPEYVAWKREYDRKYRARADYGEFWECFLLAMDIRNEALRLAGGDYELRLAKGYFDRTTQKRRRDYERLDREEPESGPLGDLERGERW